MNKFTCGKSYFFLNGIIELTKLTNFFSVNLLHILDGSYLVTLIVSFGISMAIFNNFGGKGVISNKLRELGVDEMVVSLVSFFPFILTFIVYLFWWTGAFPFKTALTMLKDEDSPPAKSDMCGVLKFQNKGGQIANPYDLLKPVKDAMKNPLEFIFDFFQKIAGAMKSKPAAPAAKPAAKPAAPSAKPAAPAKK